MTTIQFLRQFRFEGYAIFDLVVAFGGIYLLSPFLSKVFRKIRINIPKINWVFLTLPIGIVVHLLTGSMTPMTRYFIDIHSHYWLKVLIIILLILGLRKVKMVRK